MLYPNPYLYATDQTIPPSTASDLTVAAERAFKRARLPDGVDSPRATKRSRKSAPTSNQNTSASLIMNAQHANLHMHTDPALMGPADPTANKPRRVRTGCLTCRERHLKCDEAQPVCLNCRKSNRQCKRGVRLNFIDTTVRQPPIMTPIHDWNVNFHDESRDIASEYRGGLERYGAIEESESGYGVENSLIFEYPPQPGMGQQSHAHHVPSIQGLTDPFVADGQQPTKDIAKQFRASQASAYAAGSLTGLPSYGYIEHTVTEEQRDCIRDPRELSYMQAFVEHIAPWMDTMDTDNLFSEQLPHFALPSPMLYNALLACGARHLSLLTNQIPQQQDQTQPTSTADTDALQYYNTATSYLLQALQSTSHAVGRRDVVNCATTATILNVYEVMSERYKQHINHIKGARALIRECGWSARSEGIGRACFWINVGMEVLSCLTGTGESRPDDDIVRVAWDPAEWGLDMEWVSNSEGSLRDVKDEVWTQRVLYITAKIINYRASSRTTDGPGSLIDSPITRQSRTNEWYHLKSLLDAWEQQVPRSLRPMGYSPPSTSSASPSTFPHIWLIKRTAVKARLLYHTALIVLAHLHPHVSSLSSREREEVAKMRIENAQIVCGIEAHNSDRGIGNIAIAAAELTDPVQQREILGILAKIAKSSGWNVQALLGELPRKWGWPSSGEPENHHIMQSSQTHVSTSAATMIQQTPAATAAAVEQLLRASDLTPQHPQMQQLPKGYPTSLRQQQSRSRSNTNITISSHDGMTTTTTTNIYPPLYAGTTMVPNNPNAGAGQRPYYGP